MSLLRVLAPSKSDREFEYGRDGKPLHVQVPYESAARAEQIIARLGRQCGEEGFNHIIAGS